MYLFTVEDLETGKSLQELFNREIMKRVIFIFVVLTGLSVNAQNYVFRTLIT